MRLTLFDLDGTLLPNDSDHAFNEFLIELGWVDGDAHRRRNDLYFRQYIDGELDIHDYVEFATSSWRARPQEEIDAVRRRFIDEVARPQLREPALALVREHQAAGDWVAIVTATNEFVTRPIADLFGVEHLIAIDLDTDADGRVTGAIRGEPSFRDGKIGRVDGWLAQQGKRLGDFERSTFYSDSTNDLPLLERVTHPVATNPGPALERIARVRGWPILRLFE